MTTQIILIIIGVIIIIISCFMIDKSPGIKSSTSTVDLLIENEFNEERKKVIKEKIDQLIAEASEDAIVRADDTLSKISNEKIISVHEFTDQILEKINRNHEEVIFLYNMLNDKEKELKSTVKEVDTSNKKVRESIASSSGKNLTSDIEVNEMIQSIGITTQADQMIEGMKTSKETKENQQLTTEDVNNNHYILTLFSQGKSIVDISKELGMGQGEVKLVIDLFQGKK